MKTALRVFVVLLVAQILLLGVYLGIKKGRDDPAVSVVHLSEPAPELELRSADGTITRLSELRGSTVVLHFWATWCPPCREELPSLLELASSGSAEVLAVSVDPEWDAVRTFVENGPIDSVYLAASEDVSSAFGVEELPQTFVVDSNGTLRLHFRGAQDWSSRDLRAVIASP